MIEPREIVALHKGICHEFRDSSSAPEFVAAGVTCVGGDWKVAIFTKDREKTRKHFFSAHYKRTVAAIEIFDAAGLVAPLPSRALPAARPEEPEDEPIMVRPGIEVSRQGTIGCALRDRAHSGDVYFLTAAHVLALGEKAEVGSRTIGRVTESRDVSQGLDWSVIKADSTQARPSNRVFAGGGLALQGPLPSSALDALCGMEIGMTGAKRLKCYPGKVHSLDTCVAVDMDDGQRFLRYGQIVVEGSEFGEVRDSGAVAYLTSAVQGHPRGTVIGFYWRKDRAGRYHVLAPLESVLAEIRAKSGLDLELWQDPA